MQMTITNFDKDGLIIDDLAQTKISDELQDYVCRILRDEDLPTEADEEEETDDYAK